MLRLRRLIFSSQILSLQFCRCGFDASADFIKPRENDHDQDGANMHVHVEHGQYGDRDRRRQRDAYSSLTDEQFGSAPYASTDIA
jgi:hypothetical protein